MSGCYGNTQEDRYYERMLDRHLDAMDDEPGQTIPDSVTRLISALRHVARLANSGDWSQGKLSKNVDGFMSCKAGEMADAIAALDDAEYDAKGDLF